MTSEEILFDGEERMEKAVNVLRDELRGLRTGRATPALVDGIRVEYYGSPTPLKQLAQINTPDPQSIVIKPFDPGSLKDIEKAIRSSNLGMAPNNDGKIIRLIVPTMSGEQRKKLVAEVKQRAEAEKDKEMTEDERDKGKEEVQSLLKQYEGKIEELEAKKTKEIMEA